MRDIFNIGSALCHDSQKKSNNSGDYSKNNRKISIVNKSTTTISNVYYSNLLNINNKANNKSINHDLDKENVNFNMTNMDDRKIHLVNGM